MIRHTVSFNLKCRPGSPEEQTFFVAARKLAAIPGVQNLECLKQISPKNNFAFGLSMEFDNAALFALYTNHPDHADFIQEYWVKNVNDFLETDYTPFS